MNQVQFFTFDDLYLVPLCLALILIISYLSAKKYTPTFQRYFWWGLGLKLLFNFIYAIILVFYYGSGDSYSYYRAILGMHQAITDDISYLNDVFFQLGITQYDRLYDYFVAFDDEDSMFYLAMLAYDNLMLSKLSLPASFLFSKSYLCISACISFIAFVGNWRLFKTFYYLYPVLHRKIAMAVLFLPSIVFWGSGLLKDPICFGGMGFALHACYKIFIKKEKIVVNSLILLISSWFVFIMKPYIILCLVGTLPVWLLFSYTKNIRVKGYRYAVNTLLFVLLPFLSIIALQQLAQTELTSMFAFEKLLESMQAQQSSLSRMEARSAFSLGEFDGTILGFIQLFPAAVGTTFFRPFAWEANNPFMLFSALESFLFIVVTCMTFWLAGVKGFFKTLANDSFLLFCLGFSLIFAGAVGITTYNFGTLVRYKIPALPFFLVMLFVIMHRSGKADPKFIFSSRLF